MPLAEFTTEASAVATFEDLLAECETFKGNPTSDNMITGYRAVDRIQAKFLKWLGRS